MVVPSVTETVAPNKGADKANVAKLEQPPHLDRAEVVPERTCNACISGKAIRIMTIFDLKLTILRTARA